MDRCHSGVRAGDVSRARGCSGALTFHESCERRGLTETSSAVALACARALGLIGCGWPLGWRLARVVATLGGRLECK